MTLPIAAGVSAGLMFVLTGQAGEHKSEVVDHPNGKFMKKHDGHTKADKH